MDIAILARYPIQPGNASSPSRHPGCGCLPSYAVPLPGKQHKRSVCPRNVELNQQTIPNPSTRCRLHLPFGQSCDTRTTHRDEFSSRRSRPDDGRAQGQGRPRRDHHGRGGASHHGRRDRRHRGSSDERWSRRCVLSLLTLPRSSNQYPRVSYLPALTIFI